MNHEFNLAGVSVHIGIPVHREFPAQTVASLVDTALLLQKMDIQQECKMEVGGSIIEKSRSLIADNFLKGDKTHLLWIDSDIVWAPENVIRLLALGTKLECVGALYPAKNREPVRGCDPAEEGRHDLVRTGVNDLPLQPVRLHSD